MADLTPDRLQELRRTAAELRRIAAETTPGTYEWRIIETTLWRRIIALTIETALALLDRIEALEAENERLRREREVLAEAVMEWQRYLERDVGTEIVHVRTLEAHGRALALIDGKKGGVGDGR